MVDYRKMYALLCYAIDDVPDELNEIPAAALAAERLQKALFEAEELYITADEEPENV